MAMPSSSGWSAISRLPADRKDGRRMLLWEGDQPVIGRWDADRDHWEEPESMQLFEAITYWADIEAPK
nr:hypothetical protein [Sphingomonas sp. Y57]